MSQIDFGPIQIEQKIDSLEYFNGDYIAILVCMYLKSNLLEK